MDQNLRGARSLVVPLTDWNLRRAASLQACGSYSTHRERYGESGSLDMTPPRERSSAAKGHLRGLSDPATMDLPYRSRSTMMLRAETAQPLATHQRVGNDSAAWTAKSLRGTRSQELPRNVRSSSRPWHKVSPESPLEILPEGDASPEITRGKAGSPMVTQELRDQMHDLKHRISSLTERAREDSIKRRSLLQLRQSSPFTDAHGWQHEEQSRRVSPLTEDEINFEISKSARPISGTPAYEQITIGHDPAEITNSDSQHGIRESVVYVGPGAHRISIAQDSPPLPRSESGSIYEEPMDEPRLSQRHEDREDAFDYQNFFLHSSMGRFERRLSSGSTDSGATTKGPVKVSEQVPATPETPETLREIERNLDAQERKMSTDSLSTAASFATANEEAGSGRISRLQSPTQRVHSDGADSGVGMLKSRTLRKFPAEPRSPTGSGTSAAVAALIDPKGRPLGLKDKALVYMLAESLNKVCLKLQAGEETEYDNRLLRRRLDAARKALDGFQNTAY